MTRQEFVRELMLQPPILPFEHALRARGNSFTEAAEMQAGYQLQYAERSWTLLEQARCV